VSATVRTATEVVSLGRRISDLARLHPDRTVITVVHRDGDESSLTWEELDRRSNAVARLLAEAGARPRSAGVRGRVRRCSTVVVGLPNGADHFVTTIAVWKLGACVLPLPPAMPARERDALLDLAAPDAVVAGWDDVAGAIGPDDLAAADRLSPDPLPDAVPDPAKAVASGGSTGRPKIIVDPTPGQRAPGAAVEAFGAWSGLSERQRQVVCGPLYHTAPFNMAHAGLFEDHELIVHERFDPARVVASIRRHRATFAAMVPTMMLRILRGTDVTSHDVSSLEALYHTGGPCPPWVKRGWIDLVGPQAVYEAFGSTEMVGVVGIRGDDWLAHPGSLGRPIATDLRILDGDQRPVPTGEVGEIYMRLWDDSAPRYRYLGAPSAASTADGFVSVGDLGRVDEDGYLFLADRRVDMIVSGGANIYPAEVESALTEHPGVLDVVVVGIPDEEWGRCVHAIVQPVVSAPPPTADQLDAHVHDRLASYKAPRSYEFVDRLPRTEAGKVRRSALAEEREHGWRPPVTVDRRSS